MKGLFKKKAFFILVVTVMLLGFTFTAVAGPVVPGGPYPHPNMEVSRDSILDYYEVVEELYKLEERSGGKIDLEVVGYSGLGRPLYAAFIGEGEERLWIQGRIHGDEPYGAEATLDILRTLINDTPKSNEVLEEMTLMIIPVYNPDGNMEYQRGEVVEGIDLNRDWNISFETWLKTRELVIDDHGFVAFPWDWFTRFQAVESRNFYDAWSEFEPHYAVDIHHWGAPTVEGTNDMCSLGIGIPVNPAHLEPEIWDTSRQMALAAYYAAEPLGWCNPARYMYIDLPSACVSAMMTNTPGPGYPGPTWEEEYLECVMALGGKDYVFGPGYEAPDPDACDDYDCLSEIPAPDETHAAADGFVLDPEWTTAAMFLETNFQDYAQLSRGTLIRQNIVALWGIIDAIVSGELSEIDPEPWEDLPSTAGRAAPWEFGRDPGDVDDAPGRSGDAPGRGR